MTLKGHIEKGSVVLDQPVGLPDGMNVEVEVRPLKSDEELRTLYERMKDVVGIAEGLPEDMAENHDHYIHGTPKGIDRQ
jgi:hypothetical protein